MGMGIAGKSIAVVSIAICLLLAITGMVLLKSISRAQSQQADSFISLLQQEQGEQEKLLRQAVIRKGEAMARLMAQTAAGLIVGYDFDNLEQLAKNGAKDSDIASVAFSGKDGKPLTARVSQGKDATVIRQGVLFDNEPVGTVAVELNFSSIADSMKKVSRRIEQCVRATALARDEAARRISHQIAGAAIISVLVLCLAIYWMIRRLVLRPIRRVVDGCTVGSQQVAAVATQVARASQGMAQVASGQASAVEQTSASLEQLSSMTKQNADSARQADLMASEAQTAAEHGRQAIARMAEAIARINVALPYFPW